MWLHRVMLCCALTTGKVIKKCLLISIFKRHIKNKPAKVWDYQLMQKKIKKFWNTNA